MGNFVFIFLRQALKIVQKLQAPQNLCLPQKQILFPVAHIKTIGDILDSPSFSNTLRPICQEILFALPSKYMCNLTTTTTLVQTAIIICLIFVRAT